MVLFEHVVIFHHIKKVPSEAHTYMSKPLTST